MRRHEASLNVKLISTAISYYIYYPTFHGPLRIHYSQIGIYKLIVVGKGRIILIVNKSVVNALYLRGNDVARGHLSFGVDMLSIW